MKFYPIVLSLMLLFGGEAMLAAVDHDHTVHADENAKHDGHDHSAHAGEKAHAAADSHEGEEEGLVPLSEAQRKLIRARSTPRCGCPEKSGSIWRRPPRSCRVFRVS